MATRLYFRSTVYDTSSGKYSDGWQTLLNNVSSLQSGVGIFDADTATSGVLGYEFAYNPTTGRVLIVGDSGPVNYQAFMATADSFDGPWTYFQDPTIYFTSAINGAVNCCIYNPANNLFIAVDDRSNIYTSTTADSGTWTLRYNSPVDISSSRIVILNGFVIVGSFTSVYQYSSDGGLTWTAGNCGFSGNPVSQIRDMIWDGTRYIAVGLGGQLAYATSIAGPWTQSTVGVNTDCWSIAYSSALGRYCVGMENGTIRTTTTVTSAASFTAATGTSPTKFNTIRFANGRFVACGDNRTMAFSTTGTAFTVTSYNTASASASKADFWGLYYITGNTWLATTEYTPNLLWGSTDNGTNWQPMGTEKSLTVVQAGLPSVERNPVMTSDALELRTLSTTPGTIQRQASFLSVASSVANQTVLLGMFASNPLNGAQTVGGGTITLNTADGESNLNLNFWVNALNAYVWRPSTGEVVGYIRDAAGVSLGGLETASASTTASYVTNITGITSSAVAASSGDVVVCEVWGVFTNGMGTSYNGYFYYDGSTVNTTENALVTNHASFVEFTENLSFSGRLFAVNSSEALTAIESSTKTTTLLGAGSESSTASENLNALLTVNTAANETGTTTDVQFNLVSFVSSLIETGTGADSQSKVFTTNQFLIETGTASETDTASALFVTELIETGVGTDVQFNVLDINTEITETGTGTDEQFNLLLLVGALTETGTANASEFNNIITDQFLIESGAANNEETSSALFVSQLSETGTADETETNLVPFVSDLTETGTADETETNLVSFVSDLTETGTSADSQFNVFTTNQFLIETGTADETETSSVLFVSQLSETGVGTDSQFNLVSFVSDLIESGTGTDDQFNIVSFETQLIESGDLLDSQFNVFTTNQFLIESGTANETETSSALFVSQLSETGTADETETNIITVLRDITEPTTSSDSQDRLVIALRDVTESGSGTDSQFNIATRLADITETGSASETESNVISTTQFLTETGTADETETNIITVLRDITEPTTSSDSQDRLVIALRDVTETGTATTTENYTELYPVSLTETGTATDIDIIVASLYGANSSEAGSAAESQFNIITTNQFITEAGTGTDSQFNVATQIASLTESGSASETESRTALYVGLLTETGTADDSEFNTASIVASLLELGSGTDSQFNIITTNQFITESSIASETETNVISTTQFLTESGTPLDNVLSSAEFHPIINETAAANESSYNISSRIADIIEQLFAVDLIRPQVDFLSAIAETITSSDQEVSNIITYQDIIEFVTSSENVDRFVYAYRGITETTTANDRINVGITVISTETVTARTAEIGNFFTPQFVGELLSATDQSSRVTIFETLVREYGIAQELVATWVFMALDLEYVMDSTATADITDYGIYFDNIDVSYSDQDSISVEYDYIYITNIDVIYAELAVIDGIESDDISYKWVA